MSIPLISDRISFVRNNLNQRKTKNLIFGQRISMKKFFTQRSFAIISQMNTALMSSGVTLAQVSELFCHKCAEPQKIAEVLRNYGHPEHNRIIFWGIAEMDEGKAASVLDKAAKMGSTTEEGIFALLLLPQKLSPDIEGLLGRILNETNANTRKRIIKSAEMRKDERGFPQLCTYVLNLHFPE